jgi:hypothetical protein
MPTNLVEAATIIKTLPVNEVYILDQTNPELMNYPAVYQNFIKDIYEGLLKGKSKLEVQKTRDDFLICEPGYENVLKNLY